MSKITFKQFNTLSKIENPSEQQLDEIFGFGNSEKKEKAITALKKAEFEERKKKAEARMALKKINDDEDGALASRLQKQTAEMKKKLLTTPDDKLTAGQLRAIDRNPFSFESRRFNEDAEDGDPGDEEMEDVLKQIADGDEEIYNIMNHPKGAGQKAASKWLHKHYDAIASDRGYHADDDFEEIERELQKEIDKKFG